eukprot:Rmarinus@m.1193
MRLKEPSDILGSLLAREIGRSSPFSVYARISRRIEEVSIKDAGPYDLVFSRQTKSTMVVAFSQDGTLMASSHGDHNVNVMEYPSCRLKKKLVGHARTPWSVKFHPKSNTILASACLAGEVRLWNLRTGEPIVSSNCKRPISCICFHPSQNILAIATGTNVYLWHFETGVAPAMFLQLRHPVYMVKFDPSGSCVLTGRRAEEEPPTVARRVANTSGFLRSLSVPNVRQRTSPRSYTLPHAHTHARAPPPSAVIRAAIRTIAQPRCLPEMPLVVPTMNPVPCTVCQCSIQCSYCSPGLVCRSCPSNSSQLCTHGTGASQTPLLSIEPDNGHPCPDSQLRNSADHGAAQEGTCSPAPVYQPCRKPVHCSDSTNSPETSAVASSSRPLVSEIETSQQGTNALQDSGDNTLATTHCCHCFRACSCGTGPAISRLPEDAVLPPVPPYSQCTFEHTNMYSDETLPNPSNPGPAPEDHVHHTVPLCQQCTCQCPVCCSVTNKCNRNNNVSNKGDPAPICDSSRDDSLAVLPHPHGIATTEYHPSPMPTLAGDTDTVATIHEARDPSVLEPTARTDVQYTTQSPSQSTQRITTEPCFTTPPAAPTRTSAPPRPVPRRDRNMTGELTAESMTDTPLSSTHTRDPQTATTELPPARPTLRDSLTHAQAPRMSGGMFAPSATELPGANADHVHANGPSTSTLGVLHGDRGPVLRMGQEQSSEQFGLTLQLWMMGGSSGVVAAPLAILTVRRALCYSDAGVDISPCGRYLLVCVPTSGDTFANGEFELAVFLLVDTPTARMGSKISSIRLERARDLTSLRFSPLGMHVLIGYGNQGKAASRRNSTHERTTDSQNTVCVLYKWDPGSGFEIARAISASRDEINGVAFSPNVAGGFVYVTTQAAIRLFLWRQHTTATPSATALSSPSTVASLSLSRQPPLLQHVATPSLPTDVEL